MSNEELTLKLNKISNGDKTAFEELYNDMKIPIYTIISRITWDKSLSEDIVQEVFVKLFLSPPEPSIKNPRAYIFQMARNLTINSMKKQPQHMSLDEIENTVHQPINDLSIKMDMEDALKSLPDKERQIVSLHITGELKFREISDIMKIPLGTVLWKYRKAISKLKKIFKGDSL